MIEIRGIMEKIELDQVEQTDASTHLGHRQRVKKKVRNLGVRNFELHEVLELLLTYTIPRKNTNNLAHDLLNHFGRFSSVLDASITDLMKVEGVGKETALFLNMLPDVFELYKQDKASLATTFIKNTHQCVEYFRSNYEIKNKEYLYVLCLNKNFKIVNKFEIKGINDYSINIDMREFAEKISGGNTSSIIMFHTHPNGEAEPSPQDIETTQNILNVCALLRISLCDHIVLNETTHYSFGKHGLIGKMYENFVKMFDHLPVAPLMRQVSSFNYN